MASAIKSALPSRLKPEGKDEDSGFEGRHHGKTRSHMVSSTVFHFLPFAFIPWIASFSSAVLWDDTGGSKSSRHKLLKVGEAGDRLYALNDKYDNKLTMRGRSAHTRSTFHAPRPLRTSQGFNKLR